MPAVTAQLEDDLYKKLEQLAKKSGRSIAAELMLAVQMYVSTEMERQVREQIHDPKSPSSS